MIDRPIPVCALCEARPSVEVITLGHAAHLKQFRMNVPVCEICGKEPEIEMMRKIAAKYPPPEDA